METIQFDVKGMSDPGCERTITDAIERIDGVRGAEADHESGDVEVTVEEVPKERVRQAISDAGYEIAA